MLYSQGGIPIGDYNPDRIVNLGDGHGAWHNGFGYTYFNEATGPAMARGLRKNIGLLRKRPSNSRRLG